MVVEDTVDAAVRVVETRVSADRAASGTTAFGTPKGAAGFAAVVFAFEASESVAAFRNRLCYDVAVKRVGTKGEWEVSGILHHAALPN